METPSVQQPVEQVNPADDIGKWLDQQTEAAEPTTSTGQSDTEASPAEPTVAQPEPTGPQKKYVTSLDEFYLPPDFEHGFFKDKPVREFVKSFRATESEMQRAQREAKEARAAVEQLRADLAARDLALRMAAEQRQQPAQQPVDPNLAWIENPAEAERRLKAELLNEVKQTVTQETQRFRQETEAERIDRQQREAYAEAVHAFRREVPHLDEQAYLKALRGVLAEVTDPEGEYFARGGPLVGANLISAYREMRSAFGGNAPAPIQAPVVAPAANPPGSVRPAAAPAKPNKGLPTISEERQRGWRQIASQQGLDPDQFVARMTASLGGANG